MLLQIRKANSRLYSELEDRRHGGNYFDKLGTGETSGRILCLILDFICILTDPLKMNLKRGKITHKQLRKCNQWRMIERIGFFTGIDKAEKYNKIFLESCYRVESCLQRDLEEGQERWRTRINLKDTATIFSNSFSSVLVSSHVKYWVQFQAPKYKRDGMTGVIKGCEGDEWAGAALIKGEVERSGTVQPKEEKAQRKPSKSINT